MEAAVLKRAGVDKKVWTQHVRRGQCPKTVVRQIWPRSQQHELADVKAEFWRVVIVQPRAVRDTVGMPLRPKKSLLPAVTGKVLDRIIVGQWKEVEPNLYAGGSGEGIDKLSGQWYRQRIKLKKIKAAKLLLSFLSVAVWTGQDKFERGLANSPLSQM